MLRRRKHKTPSCFASEGMGSYRDAYPSGGASASAAYHYSQRLHDPSMGGEGGRFLALPVRGNVYGYSASLALHDNDLFGAGLLSELHCRSLLAHIGVSGGAHSLWRRPTADPYSQTLLTDSRALGSDVRASYGQSLYPGVSSSSPPASRTGAHTYSNTPNAFVGNAHFEPQAEQNPQGSLQASDSAAERQRKTPSLDALIKETWELHSLFRAGLAADSKRSKRSCNGTEDIMPRLKRGKQMPATNDALDAGGKWEDTPLLKEETPSSWKELDAPCKETKETFSNNKEKDSSLLMDTKQEQYASNVQRFTCERVMEFMGDSSDDHDSDEESFVDSDDGVPNVYAESSHNVKGREEQAYEFFLQMFEENKDLQKLYNEQCHVGKFECLVCSGIPGKSRKKYNGLISIIMHASKIIKTKKKQEHRGYARAVCSLLGWDIYRLPTMPLGSSPHPRCCIPADEEENTDVEKIEEVSKESENDESGALDNSHLSQTSEQNNVGEENESQEF